jgi:hypothetical protein
MYPTQGANDSVMTYLFFSKPFNSSHWCFPQIHPFLFTYMSLLLCQKTSSVPKLPSHILLCPAGNVVFLTEKTDHMPLQLKASLQGPPALRMKSKCLLVSSTPVLCSGDPSVCLESRSWWAPSARTGSMYTVLVKLSLENFLMSWPLWVSLISLTWLFWALVS